MFISKKTSSTHPHPIRWDAHGCPPFKLGEDLSFLRRYKNSGVNFVSLNVGFDLIGLAETLELIGCFNQWILNYSDDYALATNVRQLFENQEKNKLSLAFDIEGCNLLNGNIEIVPFLYSLGVRQMIFTYNQNNLAGGGCFDVDTGLTEFGRQLVKKCNDVGMVIDCSHVGCQSSIEIMELSKYPVVFSHSNPAKLVNHPRNITDEQIIACAKGGGVVGINGVGIFLGENETDTDKIVQHIDYVAQIVGSEHVGIGLDCIFSPDEAKSYVKNNPDTFPEKYGFNDVAVAVPEQFSEIGALLSQKGYSEGDINNILGENFLRIARVIWK